MSSDPPATDGTSLTIDTASLVLRTDPALLPVLHGFITGMAAASGLPERAGAMLALATEEAAANVIEHAYAGDRTRDYTVLWRTAPDGVEVAVRDKGIPFDAERLLPFQLGGSADDTDAAGLGLHLMRSAVDGVRMLNLGRQGKELVLVKRHAVARPPATPPATEPAAAEPVPITIRPMRPDEAVEAARCIWRCFEYSYPYEDIFHPDRVRAMIEAGHLVSAVAEAEGVGIVGHVGLKPVGSMPRHKEVSMLAVEPRFRRDGMAQRLTRFIVEHAATLDLDGLVAEAVTTHPGSQAVAAQVGLKPCALLIGEVPPLSFTGFDGVPQRESLVLCYHRLSQRDPVTVRVPPHLEAVTATLYAEAGLAVRVETGVAVAPVEPSVVDMDFSRVAARLHLLVLSVGGDIGRRLATAQGEAIALRADVFDVLVRLEDEAAPVAIAAAESLGARFIGLRPATAHGDLALFRMFLGCEVDLAALKLFTRTARRLREGIAGGWKDR